MTLFERDCDEPLAFQREFAEGLGHWTLPYPDISTWRPEHNFAATVLVTVAARAFERHDTDMELTFPAGA
jgi:hypothetical protein